MPIRKCFYITDHSVISRLSEPPLTALGTNVSQQPSAAITETVKPRDKECVEETKPLHVWETESHPLIYLLQENAGQAAKWDNAPCPRADSAGWQLVLFWEKPRWTRIQLVSYLENTGTIVWSWKKTALFQLSPAAFQMLAILFCFWGIPCFANCHWHPLHSGCCGTCFTFGFLAQGKKCCLLSLVLASRYCDIVLITRVIYILNAVTEIQELHIKSRLTSNHVTCPSWPLFTLSINPTSFLPQHPAPSAGPPEHTALRRKEWGRTTHSDVQCNPV